ncbi:hypothetical protein ACXR2U_14705 [Jatrophihabitans sp. YIM 134969]
MTPTPGVVLVACDLDQTLVYSRRSAAAPVDDAVCVEIYQDRPQSFVTPVAAAAIGALTAAGVFAAVTSRTREQLARITLPGPPPRFAVAANGGRLLVDGVEDLGWSRAVERRAAEGTPLAEVERHVAELCRPEWTTARRVAEGLFVYAVVDLDRMPTDVVARAAAWAADHDWAFSAQGRKLYWIPRGVSKGVAARELAERVGAETLLAAGDSHLDRDLLEVADAGWLPRHGELAQAGWRAAHVEVTDGVGLAAGEQIAVALARRAVTEGVPA